MIYYFLNKNSKATRDEDKLYNEYRKAWKILTSLPGYDIPLLTGVGHITKGNDYNKVFYIIAEYMTK